MFAIFVAVILSSPVSISARNTVRITAVCRMSKISCARLRQLEAETEYLGMWDPRENHIDWTTRHYNPTPPPWGAYPTEKRSE